MKRQEEDGTSRDIAPKLDSSCSLVWFLVRSSWTVIGIDIRTRGKTLYKKGPRSLKATSVHCERPRYIELSVTYKKEQSAKTGRGEKTRVASTYNEGLIDACEGEEIEK